MPKQKKKEKPNKSKPKNKAESKPEPKGQLIALDGTSGPMLGEESQRLARLCGEEAAWSSFDASNTVHELGMTKTKTLTPTPRVLVLLYVSDLLFRLRWEIEPTLQEGRTVVAAPYVQTAIAFGIASGLSKEWLEQLFSFAPQPVATLRLKEKKKSKGNGKKGDWKKGDLDVPGFVEFCAVTLTKNFPGWHADDVRAAMIGYLKGLEEKDLIRKFGKKAPKL
jgi:hypothetical protein